MPTPPPASVRNPANVERQQVLLMIRAALGKTGSVETQKILNKLIAEIQKLPGA